MEPDSTLIPSILAGGLFGLFAGVIGIIIRRISLRRLPFVLATLIGVIAGGTTGVVATGLMKGNAHKPALIVATGAVGAMLPWAVTWRFFVANDKPESIESESASPLQSS